MEQREAQKKLVKEWYRALEAGDADAMLAVQRDDVIYNVHGTTPVSGRFQGKDTLVNDIFPKVMGMLQMDTFKFCTKLKIVCDDEHRVVTIMQADGQALNGVRYNQTYCHMFGFKDGLISEVWEFFDSVLAEAALNNNPLTKPTKSPANAFEF
ncbi:MAG: nuclear transport factor 2 family protein [Hellea sp.]|nr:nuclear transport factor 2 family protein [Hellea sp.]